MDKESFLSFWNVPLDSLDADTLWAAKQTMDSGIQTVDAPLVTIFNEGWYEHLAPQPLHFSSKRALRSYCKEHDLTMDYCE